MLPSASQLQSFIVRPVRQQFREYQQFTAYYLTKIVLHFIFHVEISILWIHEIPILFSQKNPHAKLVPSLAVNFFFHFLHNEVS